MTEEWYELQVTWKNGDPTDLVKFLPPKHDYDFAYDHYLLCVAAAEGFIDKTSAKVIQLCKVWVEGEDEVYEVLSKHRFA